MEVFLARQGIYNQDKEVVAYELLYRDSYKNRYNSNIEENEATIKVVNTAFNLGREKLTDGRRAFVNFTADCLTSGLGETLDKDEIVIEILEGVYPSKEILSKVKKLKEKGYIIALDDVTANTMHNGFLDLIDIYKIDFIDTSKEERKKIIKDIKKINPKAQFLAEKIEREIEFKEAVEDEYVYFQGYYFSKPHVFRKEDKNLDKK